MALLPLSERLIKKLGIIFQMSDDCLLPDLFGNFRPVPGGRGRPKHIPDDDSIGRVQLGLALGWSNERISNALSISLPTFRKAYKRELSQRLLARDQLDLRRFQIVWEQLSKGNIAASKELSRLIERNDLMVYGQTIKPHTPDKAEKKAKDKKLGKKEQAAHDAVHPDTGSELGRLIAERQGKMN